MVGIDKVYQKVLAIANKEQRGYITPQEFNLFADNAQMEIFEQYFYDLSQHKRRLESSDVQYTNPVDMIEEKIIYFIDDIGISNDFNLKTIDPEFYRIQRVYAQPLDASTHDYYDYEKVTHNYSKIKTNLLSPTKKRPHYTLVNGQIQLIRPSSILTTHEPRLTYIKKPIKPDWTYYMHNGNALYSGTGVDFQLHSSEENKLIQKILQLSGIAIKDFNLSQAAGQKEVNTIQQEKQ